MRDDHQGQYIKSSRANSLIPEIDYSEDNRQTGSAEGTDSLLMNQTV